MISVNRTLATHSSTMYDLYIVKRTQIYLDEEQDRLLTKRATAVGATKSSLVREAIAAYLAKPGDESHRLARFRSAVIEAADARLELPHGAAYVETLRNAERERSDDLDARRRA